MRIAKHGEKDAVHAVTYYAVVETAGQKVAWISLKPVTGRTHQLRAHMAHVGNPIVGDPKYFNIENWELPGGIQNKLHLLARRIAVPHPRGGVIDVSAPLPPHMEQSWNLLGFDAKRYDPIDEFAGGVADLPRGSYLVQERGSYRRGTMRGFLVVALFFMSALPSAPARAQAGDIMSDNYSIMVPERVQTGIAGALACAEVQIPAWHGETRGSSEVEDRDPAERCRSAVCFRPADGADLPEFADSVGLRPWRCGDLPGPVGTLRPSGGCLWTSRRKCRQLHGQLRQSVTPFNCYLRSGPSFSGISSS